MDDPRPSSALPGPGHQIAGPSASGRQSAPSPRLLGRDPGNPPVSREVKLAKSVRRFTEALPAQQRTADRLKRPKPRKAAEARLGRDRRRVAQALEPEQTGQPAEAGLPGGRYYASVRGRSTRPSACRRGELKRELKRAAEAVTPPQTPRRPSRKPHSANPCDLPGDPGDRGPGSPRPLGGRSHHRQPQQAPWRSSAASCDPAACLTRHDASASAAIIDRCSTCPNSAQQPDLGPGRRNSPCT